MAQLIIGVSGKKRSGKDTFAQRLVEKHGFTRLAFADALKATMIDLNPVIEIHQDELGVLYGPGVTYGTAYGVDFSRLVPVIKAIGWEKAKEVREVRRLLQAHGVAMRDHVDPEVWVNAVALQAEKVAGPVVVTDVRFPNEVDYVHRVGGKLLRVYRPSQVNTDEHVSERAIDHIGPDALIINDGTVEDLHAHADALVELYRKV